MVLSRIWAKTILKVFSSDFSDVFEEDVFGPSDSDSEPLTEEKLEERLEESTADEPEIVKKVKSGKPKRAQSAGQKSWLDYVGKVSRLETMKGKSRIYVMQKASEMRKAGIPLD